MKEEVPSPCVGICRRLGGICTDCRRTINEIAQWRDLTSQEKILIWKEIVKRDYVPLNKAQKEFFLQVR